MSKREINLAIFASGNGSNFAALVKAIKEKKIKDFPVEFLAKSGEKIRALFSGTLMRNTDGAFAGLIGTTKSQLKKV